MNAVCQQCVERACEIIREPLSCQERKTVYSKLHSVIHADADEDGIDFRGKHERNWLELTALHVVEDAWLFTAFFRE